MNDFDYIQIQISESTGEVESNYFTGSPKLPSSVVFESAPIPPGTYRVVNGHLYLLAPAAMLPSQLRAVRQS